METPGLIELQDSYDEDFNLIPRDGFLNDYYYHTLGWSITNLYAFWTGIAGLSGLAGRDVKLRAAMDIFPNFYIILVGIAGISRKSTGMVLWEKVENKMWPLLGAHLRERKQTHIIRGKATPEFLFNQMKNRELEYTPGAESDAILRMRISELDNFLNKSSYNATLISKLTDFYDCKDYDTDGVLGRNHGKLIEIRNIYASLFGCTTPTALKSTLPEEAFGGGFMSRVTIVNQEVEDLKRKIGWPFFHEDAATREELGERLAWLMTYKNGQYTLTTKAMNLYLRWYDQVHDTIVEKAKKGDSDDRDNRITVQALKLATLLSFQRYDLERRVTWEDMVTAINILDWTLRKSTGVLDEVAISVSADARLLRFYRHVREKGEEGIDRRTLTRKLNMRVAEIDALYKELKARGLMQRFTKKKLAGARNINQIFYRVVDEADDGEELE